MFSIKGNAGTTPPRSTNARARIREVQTFKIHLGGG